MKRRGSIPCLFYFLRRVDISTMKIIKKAPVFNYKEFENCLLEMNNRESDVAN